MAPPAPPTAPLPDLSGLQMWKKVQNDGTLLTLIQAESHEESLVGRHLQECHDSCREWREKLEASGQAWKEARQRGDEKDAQQKREQLQMHAYYHRFCQMEKLCPGPTKIYTTCWAYAQKAFGNERLWQMRQAGRLKTICKPERDLIERCVGRLVSSSVDSLEEDDSNVMLGASVSNIHDDPEDWQ